jgi:hypothetical protein
MRGAAVGLVTRIWGARGLDGDLSQGIDALGRGSLPVSDNANPQKEHVAVGTDRKRRMPPFECQDEFIAPGFKGLSVSCLNVQGAQFQNRWRRQSSCAIMRRRLGLRCKSGACVQSSDDGNAATREADHLSALTFFLGACGKRTWRRKPTVCVLDPRAQPFSMKTCVTPRHRSP